MSYSIIFLFGSTTLFLFYFLSYLDLSFVLVMFIYSLSLVSTFPSVYIDFLLSVTNYFASIYFPLFLFFSLIYILFSTLNSSQMKKLNSQILRDLFSSNFKIPDEPPCYVRQCQLICAILLELSRCTVSRIFITYIRCTAVHNACLQVP